MTYNHILWTLDNEIDGRAFERLCTDLLFREGYKDIVPIGGTHDRGRDAEIRNCKGIKENGGVAFFQYSLEDDCVGKLKRELKKVYTNKHLINFYIFVTSQNITGYSRDKLREYVSNEYGWQLIIYDREWLRLLLEEAHPDLAVKYLGTPNKVHAQITYTPELRHYIYHISKAERAWQLYLQKDYERASIELKELVKKVSNNVHTWQALAMCQYVLFRYDEALVSINRALEIDAHNDDVLGLKASILTEDGIKNGGKANLLLARDIFKQLADKSVLWVDHYNYGNVLEALHDYEKAKQEFLKAIDNNPQQAEVWKNLGSVYYHLNDHEREIECYDNALKINDKLSQALISKGVTLLKVFGNPEEAVQLIEKGLELEDSVCLQWTYAWYWLGEAYYKINDLQKALERVDKGLQITPSSYHLLNLKALILSRLWKDNPKYIDIAIAFFKFRIELCSDDSDSIIDLAKIYNATHQKKLMEDLLCSAIDLNSINPLNYLYLTNHSFEEFLTSLKYFSSYKNFRKSNNISEYIDVLREQKILFDNDFENAIFIVNAISFGLACDTLSNMILEEKLIALEKVKNILFDSLENTFSKLGLKLMEMINIESKEQVADALSKILVQCPEIALVEFSRQFGFIGGMFDIQIKELNEHGEKLVHWMKKVMESTLIEINKKLKFFKD